MPLSGAWPHSPQLGSSSTGLWRTNHLNTLKVNWMLHHWNHSSASMAITPILCTDMFNFQSRKALVLGHSEGRRKSLTNSTQDQEVTNITSQFSPWIPLLWRIAWAVRCWTSKYIEFFRSIPLHSRFFKHHLQEIAEGSPQKLVELHIRIMFKTQI